jgi:hypothetical protein
MKFLSSIAVLIASMFVTLAAMGGHGSGGGVFGKTRLMLQSFAQPEVLLTIEGSPNFPEAGNAPQLVIPTEEYQDFVAEVEKEVTTGSKPFVLSVEMEDGSVRNFILRHVGEVGKEPLFLYLVEEKESAETDETDAE